MNPFLIAGGILILLLMASTAIATKWGYSQAEKAATAEAQRAQWEETAKVCSDATSKLEAEGEKRKKAAAIALAAARKNQASTQQEIKRLREAKAASCSAAVKTVRDGLIAR